MTKERVTLTIHDEYLYVEIPDIEDDEDEDDYNDRVNEYILQEFYKKTNIEDLDIEIEW